MQEPDHEEANRRSGNQGENESTRKERALREILSESGREHEGVKSALLVVVRKGLLILALFLFSSFLSNTELGNLIPVLVFVLGTVLIVLWRSDLGKP